MPGPVKMGEVVSQNLDLIKPQSMPSDKCTAIKSGFANFDEVTGGFHKGDLTYLSAYCGIGNDAFAYSVTRFIAEAQNDWFYYAGVNAYLPVFGAGEAPAYLYVR